MPLPSDRERPAVRRSVPPLGRRVRMRLLVWVLRRPRIASTCLTLLLLLAANLAIATNGRYWDAQSDGFWGLRRIAQCESLGSVPDVLFIGSSRTLYGVRPAQVDALMRRQNRRPIVSCNIGMLGSTLEQDYLTPKPLNQRRHRAKPRGDKPLAG